MLQFNYDGKSGEIDTNSLTMDQVLKTAREMVGIKGFACFVGTDPT
jgi:hypothetical protein